MFGLLLLSERRKLKLKPGYDVEDSFLEAYKISGPKEEPEKLCEMRKLISQVFFHSGVCSLFIFQVSLFHHQS